VFFVLRPEQHGEWMKVLRQSYQYDFYHLPRYHSLAQRRGEGSALLFVYADGAFTVAMPLLLRSVRTAPGLCDVDAKWQDATIVYGYVGPVASHRRVPAYVAQRFTDGLSEALRQRHVVSVFSRLHPLIAQDGLLTGFGEQRIVGRTIAIDLTLPADLQRARYRANHRRDINRLLKTADVVCVDDRERHHLGEFVDIYYETMRRVHAKEEYFFEPEYFDAISEALGQRMRLFICLLDGRVISGGLFVLCNGIVEYHLGGTLDQYSDLGLTKLLIDTVRAWATERGAHTFHLGGGTGRSPDSLMHFKEGFSDRAHDFAIWRAVLSPEIYRELCREKAHWDRERRLEPTNVDFFPEYRCPTTAMANQPAGHPPDERASSDRPSASRNSSRRLARS
jgi:hypothetical protein